MKKFCSIANTRSFHVLLACMTNYLSDCVSPRLLLVISTSSEPLFLRRNYDINLIFFFSINSTRCLKKKRIRLKPQLGSDCQLRMVSKAVLICAVFLMLFATVHLSSSMLVHGRVRKNKRPTQVRAVMISSVHIDNQAWTQTTTANCFEANFIPD